MPHPLALLARLALAFVLTYVLGFERELRGSPAGDRTFALIGVAGAVIGMIAVNGAQGILSGAATGVGFIGAALVFRPGISPSGVLHGVTTAAAILGSAVVGAAAGQGHPLLAIAATALILLILEIQHLPGLRLLDAGRYSARFRNDRDNDRDQQNHT